MTTLSQRETGCLLIADITGYTSYLQRSELEHAQDVLADLLETLVVTLQPVFTLSKLEGDAAFAYAPVGRVSPTLILDTVEAGYFAFRRRLRDIDNATSCECNACLLIPSLDLKYFVHHGEFVARRIAGNEELTGSDVVVVHRLTKGQAGKQSGFPAYAVYTKKTIESFGMNPDLLGFVPYTEELSDVGEVEVVVQDLGARWAFETERHRVYVTEEEAVSSVTWPLPVSPEVAWEYVTSPEKRAQWNPSITSFEPQTPGRLGAGSVNHCMHGEEVVVEHVADWRPFSYFTLEYPMPHLGEGEYWRHTYEFGEDDEGPAMTLRFSFPTPGVRAWWEQESESFLAGLEENGAQLVELWESLEPAQA
ncbi:MAG TPA: DUF2652 domain-containing protein [Acidimicrobiia bacterium]|nr:DUF2652 domain-containing protein [Acidimicrobiia bacterium]